jgi:hypothetical protein
MDFNAALKIEKDQPGTGDVHVSSAGGTGKPGGGKPKKAGRKTVDGVIIKAEATDAGDRALVMHDDKTAQTPFKYDRHALADLRPDQVPRFFGALTDPDDLKTEDVAMGDLYAMQNRVDPGKVDAILSSDKQGDPPVVVRFNGKNYIADGHHRLTAQWLAGADKASVRVKNIGQRSNALKSDGRAVQIKIAKTAAAAGEAQNRVFGWASVTEKDGKTVVDVQDDWISEPDLEEAFYDFVKSGGVAGEMHTEIGIGDLIECMVFTKEKQKILKIDLGQVSAWVGFEVTPEAFAKFADGTYPGFSIGGSGVRLEGKSAP